MAIIIRKEDTIIDYLNVCIDFTEATPTDIAGELVCVGLNKGEWSQFITLIRADYKNAAQYNQPGINIEHALKYKHINVYWDGNEDSRLRYFEDMLRMRGEIQAVHDRARQLQGQQGNTARVPARTTIGNRVPNRAVQGYINMPNPPQATALNEQQMNYNIWNNVDEMVPQRG